MKASIILLSIMTLNLKANEAIKPDLRALDKIIKNENVKIVSVINNYDNTNGTINSPNEEVEEEATINEEQPKDKEIKTSTKNALLKIVVNPQKKESSPSGKINKKLYLLVGAGVSLIGVGIVTVLAYLRQKQEKTKTQESNPKNKAFEKEEATQKMHPTTTLNLYKDINKHLHSYFLREQSFFLEDIKCCNEVKEYYSPYCVLNKLVINFIEENYLKDLERVEDMIEMPTWVDKIYNLLLTHNILVTSMEQLIINENGKITNRDGSSVTVNILFDGQANTLKEIYNLLSTKSSNEEVKCKKEELRKAILRCAAVTAAGYINLSKEKCIIWASCNKNSGAEIGATFGYSYAIDSLLEKCKEWGIKAEHRPIPKDREGGASSYEITGFVLE